MAVAATEQVDQSNEELRDFALRVYAREQVANACLEAQDRHGMDVNLLLFGAWLADRSVVLSASDLAAAEDRCRHWREAAILPLRRQRRAWSDDPERVREYQAIKRLEVSAEFEQLAMLASLAAERRLRDETSEDMDTADCLVRNFAVLCEYYTCKECALHALAAALSPGDQQSETSLA